jgi:hypothetical protein
MLEVGGGPNGRGRDAFGNPTGAASGQRVLDRRPDVRLP